MDNDRIDPVRAGITFVEGFFLTIGVGFAVLCAVIVIGKLLGL